MFTNKRFIIGIAIIFVLGGTLFLFNKNRNKYTIDKNIDFSIEVSGRLSENNVYIFPEYDEYINTFSDKSIGEKTLRWGIKRNIDGKLPDADPGAPDLLKKYNSFYLGDTSKKEIFLTFDEGYEAGYTSKILDILKANNVKAAFFVTGPYLKGQQDLIGRMVKEGHTVGNHTINHPSLPEVSDKKIEDEVIGLDRMFYEQYKQHMKFLRPPKGEYSERTLNITNKLGYKNVFWSVAYDDWYRDKVRGPEYARKIIARNLHNGAIILLHAVSRDNSDALDSIIKDAKAEGYQIGDINNIR